ncbi:hypothetical protein [Hymenobacter elongatus]|uniref:Uncharacterized protein n=1 Tax=Hymenobacter elongatus TaxID=877208 RepID=A0A4Z0PGU0_9BACT|nr:hypothetical protein [Hymenobacter elongatus]TGE14006.1 hypothetical protein E5J99_17965 [Hymenobacter elongatus]
MENYPEEPKRRSTLKQYFKQGTMPTEESFAHLIDSAVNRLDDGFYKHPQYGLQLGAAEGRPNPRVGRRLLSLYRNLQQLQNQCATWVVSLLAPDHDAGSALGLGFSEPQGQRDTAATDDTPPPVRLYLAPGGNVGIGTTSPDEQLSVAGFVGSAGRIGTFQNTPTPAASRQHAAAQEVPADGEWHDIISGLQGLWGFEIVAAAYGPRLSGTYAMAHTIALGVHGQQQRIVPHRAAYRGWRQQLQFCWHIERTPTVEEPVPVYGLRVRTRKHFGPGATIVYHITCLFDNCQPRSW